jgi:hypothetical protein
MGGMPPADSRGAPRSWLLLALLAAAGALPLLWPADVPWINDEPALLGLALRATQAGELPSHGLLGSVGVPYGPVPLWLYMAGLGLTHDLVALVVLRVVLFALMTAGAIWWVARTCRRLDPLVGVLALLSPYFWFYSRLLWDNSFLIPFSALALAAYVSFSQVPASWKLWLVGGLAALMLQTHLMCAPLLAAFALHFAVRHRGWARAHWPALLPLLLVAASCWPYVSHLLAWPGLGQRRLEPTGGIDWLSPLLGGRYVSALGLDYFFGERWQDRIGAVLWTATGLSALGLGLFWLGLVDAARTVIRQPRRPEGRGAEFDLAALALTTLSLQLVLHAAAGTGHEPHYLNGTWFCAFVLVWLGYSCIHRTAWRRALAGAHALALLVVVLALLRDVHARQGNSGLHFGPTLGTQMAVLDELSRYHPQSEVINETTHYAMFPQAFVVLQDFHPVRQDPGGPLARLHIRQATPGSDDGRLAVEAEPLATK